MLTSRLHAKFIIYNGCPKFGGSPIIIIIINPLKMYIYYIVYFLCTPIFTSCVRDSSSEIIIMQKIYIHIGLKVQTQASQQLYVWDEELSNITKFTFMYTMIYKDTKI